MTATKRLLCKSVHYRMIAAAVFLAAFCLSAAIAGQAYAEVLAAKLTYKEGSVMVARKGGQFVAASAGQRLIEGDMLKTGRDAKAVITFNENSTVNMGPEARLEIKEYMFDYDTEKRNVVVKGYSGKMRFVVSKIFKASSNGGSAWNDSNFSVQTPTATAGIKGTEFVIVVSPTHTYFAVFSGAISARNISGLIRGEVLLGVNQASVVKRDAPPKPASDVSGQQKQNLIMDTSPTVTAKLGVAPTGVSKEPSEKELAEARAKEKAAKELSDKQEAAKIAQAAAEGKKVGDIVDKMVEDGKNVDEAVALAIKAGIDPAVVIEAAIKKEYSSEKVVEGAVEAGVKPVVVVRTASDAGAAKEEIIAAFKEAGASKETLSRVADTLAKLDTSAGEPGVFGFTPLAEPVTITVISLPAGTTTTPLIGGGGGAASSTEIASPSKPTP